MPSILLSTALVCLGAFFLLWVVSVVIEDASIVDPFWGASFVLVAWVAFAQADDPGTRQTVVPVLVTIWGVRLSLFLALRNLGHVEDYRYRAMRRRWGKRFPLISLGTVFLLHASLMWIVSLPTQATMVGTGDLGGVAILGWGLWVVGLVFETGGDWQLARFKKDPSNAGKVLDRGLWRYTRHPNYFGDFCVWWGIFLIAITGWPMLWTIIGPLVMSALLLRVSGVSLLEKTITQRRPGYEEYARRTATFFPRPPRSGE